MGKIRCSYSAKQLVTIRDFAKDKMVVHSGPFGVGKTSCLMDAFGTYCCKLQQMGTTGLTFVLAGKTQQSVKRNMCNVLSKKFGKNFEYFRGNKDGMDRDARLFGQNLYIIGFNDSTSREKFQGISDIMGVLHDECTLCTREQFDYMIGRLRGEINVLGDSLDSDDDEGEYIDVDDNSDVARHNKVRVPNGTVTMWYVGSCNPDAPNHFIKQYIDEGILLNRKWYMKDAIWNGAKAYYDKLARQYAGNPAFFARYLRGKWTSADRMVYRMFQPKVHVLNAQDLDVDLSAMRYTFLSVDYGSDHPTAILTISKNYQGIYLVSREKKLTGTAPSDIAKELATCIDDIVEAGGTYLTIYIDPSARALKDELDKHRLSYTNALNSHADGIGCVQTLLSLGKLFIMNYCTGLIGEIYTYRYKDTQTGKDEVIKLGDDFVDALRYGVHTDSTLSRR